MGLSGVKRLILDHEDAYMMTWGQEVGVSHGMEG
jgi:hypothetical protein